VPRLVPTDVATFTGGRTALVTGGAGFIASHLVNRLIVDGWNVTIVDNLRTGKRENVDDRATFYEMDLLSPELAQVFEQRRPNVVFHLAAQASVTQSMADPVEDARINVVGTLNLLQACGEWPVDHFAFTSTGGALYGEAGTEPRAEDHPVKPISVYGASKYAAEGYLRVLAEAAGFPYTVLRPGNVFGPRQDPTGEAGVVAIFAKQMLAGEPVTVFGDGTQERDYIYVDDIVEANIRAVNSDSTDGSRAFNIGTGIRTNVLRIFELLAEATGYSTPPVHAPKRTGEVQRIYLDAGKAHRELGWKPMVSIGDGIRRTVDAMRKESS
jgi:UDP-glucose 4-epimerase